MKIIINILFLILFQYISNAQLMRATKEMGNYHDKEIYVDTSGVRPENINNKDYYKRTFAKEGWVLWSDMEIINLPKFKKDTTIEFNWNKIDTTFSRLRNKLQLLEKKRGSYVFRKQNPEVATGKAAQFYYIIFDKLQNAKNISDYFNSIKYLNCGFENYLEKPLYIPNDRGLNPRTWVNKIMTEQPDFFWKPNFHKLGFGWNIYSLNLPMAWEINMGDSTTVVAVYDIFDCEYDDHPDLKVESSNNESGNWKLKMPINAGDGLDKWSFPPGRVIEGSWADDGLHGTWVLSSAIAYADNDNLSIPATGGLVGTCPECTGIAFWGDDCCNPKPTTPQYDEMDCDFTQNNDTLKISVLSYSWTGRGERTYYEHLIKQGILMCAAASNNIGPGCKHNGTIGEFSGYCKTSKHYTYYYTHQSGRGQNVYIPDVNDPKKDYKIISVTGTRDGNFFDKLCDNWGDGYDVAGSPNWKGIEHFIDGYMFSPGVDKFNNQKDMYYYNCDTLFTEDTLHLIYCDSILYRRKEKEAAYIDVAAPGASVFTATNGIRNLNCDVYNFLSEDWKECNCPEAQYPDNEVRQYCIARAVSHTRKYTPNISGTSISSPQVAGILGLMVSLNKYMGVELNENYNRPINGENVQKKAYDILTFTAKKLKDYGYTPESFYCDDYWHFIENPKQEDYVTQGNDWLLRSWAQRMGFGKVNAYRAVAHSIEQKGDYEYSLSNDLTLDFDWDDGSGDARGYVNPDGQRVMHWGSKVKEGNREFELPDWRGPNTTNDGVYDVLDWGGVSFPDEYHNNWGVTRVNNSSTISARRKITVPYDCILAIDGILISDQPNQAHYVLAPDEPDSTEGKILFEGYIKDFEIAGNIRVGDAIVESSIISDNYGEPGCIGFNGGNDETWSEVYGHVKTIDYGFVYNWELLRLKPGSIIDLQGEKDLVLRIGSETHMEYGSAVQGKEGRRIDVGTGAELVIDPGAKVDIDCELYVRENGEVHIMDSAIVNLKNFHIEPAGTLIVEDGAHLALTDEESICRGHLYFNGIDTNKIKVTGMIGEHCRPDADTMYYHYDNIKTHSTIYVEGYCGNPEETFLEITDTDFKDVNVYVLNARTDPIVNSSFSSSTREFNPHMQFDYMLSLNLEDCFECDDSLVTNKTIENCKFFDMSGPNINTLEPDNPNKYTYNTGGLMCENLERLWVTTSLFKGLEYGIWTQRCDSVTTTYSQFDTCGIGDYDKGSYTLLCHNNYNLVEFGSIRDHSLDGRVYENSYNNTRIGFNVISGDWIGFRNNSFNEFYYGIQSTCNELYLGPKPTTGDEALIFGGNQFSITDPATYTGNPEDYPNQFVYVTCDTNHADVHLIGDCCDLNMYCGYNNMATFTKDHLRHDGPGSTPSVDVSVNDFNRPGGAHYVDDYDVNWFGNPI